MRTRIGFFALMILTTLCSGKARSAGWPMGLGLGTGTGAGAGLGTRHSGFLSGKHCGAVPPRVYGSDDDIWCPKYSYFAYAPADVAKETLTEYRDSWNPRVPGMNPDVFAMPPLPYGRGRVQMRAVPVVNTAPAASVPADASAPAPTPPPVVMP